MGDICEWSLGFSLGSIEDYHRNLGGSSQGGKNPVKSGDYLANIIFFYRFLILFCLEKKSQRSRKLYFLLKLRKIVVCAIMNKADNCYR